MARAKIPRSCKTCGVEYIPWTGNAGLYCSADCYHKNKDTVTARFLSKINKTPDCWLWTGKVNVSGYGKSSLGPAHRVMWAMHNGPIPKGLWVLHKCDVPLCVRPDHLFIGTHCDNSADMVSKGRSPWGDKHPNARLTKETVTQIRAKYADGNTSLLKLAREFSVSQSAVHAIIRRKTWRYL